MAGRKCPRHSGSFYLYKFHIKVTGVNHISKIESNLLNKSKKEGRKGGRERGGEEWKEGEGGEKRRKGMLNEPSFLWNSEYSFHINLF